jgi:hypothetical protein
MSQPNSAGRPASTPLGQMERRAWVRYGTDQAALCRTVSTAKDVGWPGRVRDISAGGIGLLLRHRFRVGTPLLIELHTGKEGPPRLVAVRVVHTTPVPGEGGPCWLIGCAFRTLLDRNDLDGFLADKPAGS